MKGKGKIGKLDSKDEEEGSDDPDDAFLGHDSDE